MGLPIMRVDRLLERYWSPFLLSWLMLIGYLHAWGIARLAEAVIAGNAPNRFRPPKPRALARNRSRTAEAIIRRNPFESMTGSLARAAAPRVLPANADPLSAPQCESARVVIVSEAREPLWSVAALRTAGESRARNYRVGDRIAESTVAFIGFNPAQQVPSVWLSSDAGLCQTSLFGAHSELPLVLRAAQPSALNESPSAPRVSHVTVVPELSGGVVVGIRLFGIRSPSVLELVGLQNGDRLDSVNGFALGSPEQSLRAYIQLRSARRISLNIQRRGRPLTLAYRID